MRSPIKFMKEKRNSFTKILKRKIQNNKNQQSFSRSKGLRITGPVEDLKDKENNSTEGKSQLIKAIQPLSPPVLPQIPKTMDPFHILPSEITADIIVLLPHNVRLVCMQVSNLWREKVLSSAEAWHVLSLENGEKDIPLVRPASSLALHVKDLTIDTTSDNVRSEYIKQLQQGHFKKIQSLKSTVLGVHDVNEHLKRTATALYHVENTLTKLNIDVSDSQNSLTISSILSSCRNLTDLAYSTKSTLSAQLGKFRTIIKHGCPSLINLELSSTYINGHDMELILQGCQQLRRLVVDECDDSVLDIMVSQSTPNLELFSFNDKVDGPPLPMLQDRMMDKDNEVKIKKQGLRILYTSNGERVVRSEYFIPLLYKHRDSLEYVRACLSPLSASKLQSIYEKYPRFKLENLKHLATWLEPGTQEFMLRTAIRGAKELSSVTVANDHNLELLFTTLIDRVPLTGLNLSHIYTPTDNMRRLLIRLFQKYAQASSSSVNNNASLISSMAESSKTITSLNWIKLRYCSHPLVTDEVLMALASVKTLHDIHLGGLIDISTNGIIQMINTLGNQITHMFLHDMHVVQDSVLFALGSLDNLSLVKLELLNEVTDQGILALVDKKMKASQKLLTLEVAACILITQDAIQYVQKKIRTVRYNSPYSEYYVTKAKNNYYAS